MSAAMLPAPGLVAAPSPAAEAALAVRAVGYHTHRGVTLLAGVSAQIEPGRVLAVIGPNGAGKTTLLRLLTGELTPTSGAILLADRPLTHWPAPERARRLAVLPQQSTLSAALTGLEVALLGRSPHATGGNSAADVVLAHEALVLMDAAHLAARLYPSLSGGEKSRVQAARVLAQILEPEREILSGVISTSPARFLLLDEPTAALDCAHQHQLLGQIRQVARAQNIGVMAVLHDLNLAAQYSDELLALQGGRTAAYGRTREVFRAEMLSTVFDLPMLVISHPRHGWPMAIPG